MFSIVLDNLDRATKKQKSQSPLILDNMFLSNSCKVQCLSYILIYLTFLTMKSVCILVFFSIKEYVKGREIIKYMLIL